LIIIALGVWILIIQNAIIHKNQIVYVRGGNIDASIENTVDVKGSVDVYNTVSVSIEQVRGTDNRYYYFNNR
jgi:hypothetical protein